MSNKVITILYHDNIHEMPIFFNITYSKKWMDKLNLVNNIYINDIGITSEQENIIKEIEQRITNIEKDSNPLNYFGKNYLVIPFEEIGSWSKYIIESGEQSFHSVGFFVVGCFRS